MCKNLKFRSRRVEKSRVYTLYIVKVFEFSSLIVSVLIIYHLDGGQVETKINYNRLVLCEVTADIMQRCFSILGIRQLEKM